MGQTRKKNQQTHILVAVLSERSQFPKRTYSDVFQIQESLASPETLKCSIT